jgi:hypothetical protein
MNVEEAIIRAFFEAARRDRWVEQLARPGPRRRAMLDKLNHCKDLDARYARLLPSIADVVSLLRSRGAPASAYVLSDWDEIDGKTLPLDQAVREAERGGWGTIVSCVPGQLAYYYDERGERRMLLERKDA